MLERSFTVDVLKVVAAQLIVWHHFSAYGPMADTMNLMWPNLIDWLYLNARLAVQVFLVVGGYLAAQSVMKKTISSPLASIAKRYLRLVPFYMLALALISVAVGFSREVIHAEWLPGEPTVAQPGVGAGAAGTVGTSGATGAEGVAGRGREEVQQPRASGIGELAIEFDLLVGGVGLRRGRRDPAKLLPGDAVDFWRVEYIEPESTLRLRAEMKMPGLAWLQFELNGDESTGESVLTQTAIYAPKGLLGHMYWWAVYPMHGLVFPSMVKTAAGK